MAELFDTDTLLRVGVQLSAGLKQIAPASAEPRADRMETIAAAITQAVAEGDVRADHDPAQIAYTLDISMRAATSSTGRRPDEIR